MNRRDFLKQASAMAGAALLSPVKVLSGVMPAGGSWLDSGMVMGVDLANGEDTIATILGYSNQLKTIIWTAPNFEQLSYNEMDTLDLYVKVMALSMGLDRKMLEDRIEENLAQEDGGFFEIV